MAKRKALPVKLRNSIYHIFVDDVLLVYHRIKKPRPKLPKFIDDTDHADSDEPEIIQLSECRSECKDYNLERDRCIDLATGNITL